MSLCDIVLYVSTCQHAECTSTCQYKHPPYKWLEKYEKWCELPLHLRLSTPLELPVYKPYQSQFLPSGSEGKCKLSDWPGNYGKIDDIVQIVAQLQSEVNGSEIEMKNKESEYDSKIQAVRTHFEVEIDRLTAELSQKSTLIDELKDDVDEEIKFAELEKTELKRNHKSDLRRIQEIIDSMVQGYQKLLADEKSAKENLADQLNSANIKLKSPRLKITPYQ